MDPKGKKRKKKRIKYGTYLFILVEHAIEM